MRSAYGHPISQTFTAVDAGCIFIGLDHVLCMLHGLNKPTGTQGLQLITV